jgi:uncharacterized protein (DUF1697 family)
MRYVAFLRGINVGGRSVKKEQLHETFSLLGFSSVSTFRQSGNVVFESSRTDAQKLIPQIEAALKTALGYDVEVFIRSISQIKALVDMDVFRGESLEDSSFLVTFLKTAQKFPLSLPVVIPKSNAQVIKADDREIYSITHGGGEGALPNPFVEAKLKVKTTTRNLNVLVGILEKFS